jgi:hypothetical protein
MCSRGRRRHARCIESDLVFQESVFLLQGEEQRLHLKIERPVIGANGSYVFLAPRVRQLAGYFKDILDAVPVELLYTAGHQ